MTALPVVSRRRLLLGSGAAAAVGLLPRWRLLAAQPAEPAKLKLGLVTYNWGKNWDIPTIIKNCSETGFTGVELRSTHRHGVEISLNDSQRQVVRQRFADSGVELMGLGSACEYHAADAAVVQKNIDETKQFIDLCHAVGASGVKVRPNGLPADVPVEKTLEQIGKALNTVAKYGADHGVQIRLEVHGRGTSEPAHIRTIMEVADHPNNVVCWNCNPGDLKGPGFAENYQMGQHRMGTVHIHDLTKDNYPWDELFEQLKSCTAPGFTGWTLLEDGSVPKDIVGAMHANRKAWEGLVG